VLLSPARDPAGAGAAAFAVLVAAAAREGQGLPGHVFDALVQYASAGGNSTVTYNIDDERTDGD
jgi:hypothetical protein